MWREPSVLVAIISGSVALIIALWNYFSGRKTQRDIEILKNELAQKKSENDARREYEFEARKKLYQEYEPLLFQLMEASENAMHRIQSLARTAKDENLDENSWLSQFSYYTKSTIYKLFVPIAIYQIMQKKLTLVDITVDKSIGLRYMLAKQVYLSYTDDFEFARTFKNIEYNPNDVNWEEERNKNPIRFWRQGLPMGLLDKTIEILIEKGEDGKERVISYGEFERKLGNLENNETAEINLSRDIFFNFHPQKRPILWRILIAQSLLFKVLLTIKNVKPDEINNFMIRDLLLNLDLNEKKEFSWSKNPDNIQEFEEPFLVAVEYFKKRF